MERIYYRGFGVRGGSFFSEVELYKLKKRTRRWFIFKEVEYDKYFILVNGEEVRSDVDLDRIKEIFFDMELEENKKMMLK